MKHFTGSIVWFITLFTWTYQADLNIAIIGSGIGGTSCAHFLREIFHDSIEIDIYEGNKVGGRLDTVVLNNGFEYEIGGSIIHDRNKYMSDLTNLLGLEKRNLMFKDEKLGLYNGLDFDFIQKENSMFNVMSIFWRYGYSVKRLKSFINDMLDKFDRIYELQKNNESFESINDLLTAMDPKFADYLNVSVKDAFLVNDDFSESLINELVQGSLRVNYGQNINVHEFVGSVSMAGMDGTFWAVKGGNKKVPEKLLEHSKANFINEYVTEIIKNEKSYTLITATKKSATYDYVVFAAPLAENQKVPITFSNVSLSENITGKYHRTVSTMIVGDIIKKKFSPLSDETPQFLVISYNDNEYFNSLSNVGAVNETYISLNVWKIFSQKPLTQEQIEMLFDNIQEIRVVDWLAYPHYEVPTTPRNFRIADGLYHINAIEWAASAMEMICIGAKNVALLIEKHYHEEQSKNTTGSRRSEL